MDTFKRYINQFRCEKGQPYTHTSIANPQISIHVPEEKAAEFNAVYTKAMVMGASLHMTEKPTDPSPMRADLDYRFILPESKEVVRRYTSEDVQRILRFYFETLSAYIDAPADAWTAYVMEKPEPTEYRGKVKDGIHIVWPDIVVSHTFQHLVRKKMLDCAQEMFAGMTLCNTYEDIIDQAIIDKNNWQMYGSHKPESSSYRVTSVYRYHPDQARLEELPVPTAAEELTFVSLFSMRHKTSGAVKVKDDKVAEFDDYVRLVLPTMDERKKSKLHSQIFGKSLNHARNFVSDEELTLARQLVAECLNPKRAENYEEWIKVGWTLRNIDYRLLDAWMDFSKCSSKYIEGECNSLWDKMRIDTLGMGTLRWWASLDNPMKYNEILDQSAITLIDRCIGSDGAHFDVARVVHALYKDRYRFTTKDLWYMFREDKHRWVRTREGLQLRLVLSNEVCSKFMERASYWNREAMKVTDGREIIEEKAKKLTSIALRLKQTGYKDSLMKECKCLFTDEKFEELLDSHPHLIGFENGVYDLRMHEFRDGLPDDYISFSTGRHYFPFDPSTTEATEIHQFMSSVYTNDSIRRYMTDVLSCIIDGGIRQEKFYIMTGSGCHAKGTQIRMFDGATKAIEDIDVGESLMGDDNSPRVVERLWRGKSDMYRISPVKGDPFIVNGSHKLTVRITAQGNPTVKKYCNAWKADWLDVWYRSSEDGVVVSTNFRFFRTEQEAEEFINTIPNDKILREGDVIDVQVKVLVNENNGDLSKYTELIRTCVEYEDTTVEDDVTPILTSIPNSMKITSREKRIALLTSIISVNPTLKFQGKEELRDDFIEVARSLGYVCYKTEDYGVELDMSDGVQDRIGFHIERVDDDDYYGVQVDGNHRYLMADYMVTCNSNGKSKLLELMQKAIGDYFCILPIALLTQKRVASNSAQSELERTKGRRFAVMQEPGENERLNIGLMKELSGGDRIICRGLFKEPIEFKPQFKMAMTCNELPEVPSDDGGTWRRIRVIEHTSKFVEHPNPANSKEFLMDPEITDKFDRWADTFISMLIHHHSTIDPKNIVEPREVKNSTEGYKKNNDVIGQFVDQKMKVDEESTDRVSINKAYTDFKVWVNESGIKKDKKIPDRNQFRAYMEKQFGAYPSDGKGWRGIRYIGAVADDDVE